MVYAAVMEASWNITIIRLQIGLLTDKSSMLVTCTCIFTQILYTSSTLQAWRLITIASSDGSLFLRVILSILPAAWKATASQ